MDIPLLDLRTQFATIRSENTLLWTYYRLLTKFPTAPEPAPAWPKECSNDSELADRILLTAGEKYERTSLIEDPKLRRDAEFALYKKKIQLLMELAAFEASRSTRDTESGASTDLERKRYKISQAAWASRFMSEKGRRLRIEDETINVAWEGTTAEAAAREREKAKSEPVK